MAIPKEKREKREKSRNLPKFFKILGNFEIFFLKMWRLFKKNSQKLP
jgi:hypothetical protein